MPETSAADIAWQHARKLEREAALLLEGACAGEGAERSEQLLPLVAWLSRESLVLLPPEAPLEPRAPAARLWILLRVLRAQPPLAARLGDKIRALLEETTAIHLFCDAGMGGQRTFAGEAVSRISLKLLPAAPDDRHLDEVTALLFPSPRAARWLRALPWPLLEELWALLFPAPGAGGSPWRLLRDDMADAVIVLAGRVAAEGLQNDVRVRSGPRELHDSPFFSLPHQCREVAALARAGASEAEAAPAQQLLASSIAACRALLARAVAHQERNGVSVDLVHRLERMGRQLTRIEQLLALLLPDARARAGAGQRFFAALIAQTCDDRSLRSLVQRSVQQLARKIVESAGATGEHYIAASRAEYREMLKSAAGAGLITALTTLIKYSLADLPLPPFLLGALSSLNYAASFLVIYFLGWTLATKQPAATAATLAQSMSNLSSEEDLERMVEQIARTTRSQLAAIAGNLCTVIPGALALDLLLVLLRRRHFFDEAQAAHALQSLHPLRSLLVLYAALTGVLLWLSSIAAGWFNNWSSYRRLPEALARSRALLQLVGPARRARLTAFVEKHIGGISGNVSLGILLGMAPFAGAFFGLPTEIRHVTLSTGLLAFAAVEGGVTHASFFWAVLGIAVIGLFNFAVSFRLALWLASRSCGVEPAAFANLRKAFLRELWRRPGRFIFQPGESAITASET